MTSPRRSPHVSDTHDRTRDDRGQYDDRIPPERVLDAFQSREDMGRPLTANDVMEALECSRRTAHNKLGELVERGDLETRKVGARSRVWWVPIDPEDLDPSALVTPESEEGMDEAPESASPAQSRRRPAVRDAIEDADLPGSGPQLDARREALSAAYAYLTDYPEATKSDFLRDVYSEHPAGFRSAEAWWNAIQPALKDLPDVDPPDEREHIWHFLGG
jgi:hypothetical protein